MFPPMVPHGYEDYSIITNDDMLTTNMFNTEYKIENIYTLLKHINICVDKKYNQKENIKQVEYLNKLLLNSTSLTTSLI